MRLLLTNDDGPPGAASPYIVSFYELLATLTWVDDIKVVIPTSQRSWIASNGLEGESSPTSRPLKDDELAEWILLDGFTCVNVALHNLFPGQVDLVISGPNLGRNVPAFAMSSGTLGAALDAALSNTRSIALSYGTVIHPTPNAFIAPAHILAGRIISQLVEDDGSFKSGEVDLYNVNIPLVSALLSEESLKVVWTFIWRNHYGRLFKAVSNDPDAAGTPLAFKFSPSMDSLLKPDELSVPVGSDGHAMLKGWASITPLRASFSEPDSIHHIAIEDRVWKMKL
ncbi:survival protein sure-like phosphatase/nucleotidase [Mycena amicta]|nr:survival protein sure-like phosphatase/nucleotidase [Mycena amicta]